MAYEKYPNQAGQNFPVATQYATHPGTAVGFPVGPQYGGFPSGEAPPSGGHLLDTGGVDILTDGSGNQLIDG